jgi:hypothetical protein
MHFEIFIEDHSGKKMLEIIVPKLISNNHTVKIHPYKGLGRLPKDLRPASDANKRILLDQLPSILRGLGKSFKGYGTYPACVVVVVDADSRDPIEFMKELKNKLKECNPAPTTEFCIAVEEGEAWLLGDRQAVEAAYPRSKRQVLDAYKQDSICGTWEVLAEALYPGGAKALKEQGWQAVGTQKATWAVEITPHMKPDRNKSPSFNYFKSTVLNLAQD